MDPAHFSSKTLADFYRFALLLTGNVRRAERALAETLTECDAQIGQLRKGASRDACLASRLRTRCLQEIPPPEPVAETPRLVRADESDGVPPVLAIEAYIVAQRFHQLPEPERSALGLFYLDCFTAPQIAALLKLTLLQLSETLGRARARLQDSLAGRHTPGAVS